MFFLASSLFECPNLSIIYTNRCDDINTLSHVVGALFAYSYPTHIMSLSFSLDIGCVFTLVSVGLKKESF